MNQPLKSASSLRIQCDFAKCENVVRLRHTRSTRVYPSLFSPSVNHARTHTCDRWQASFIKRSSDDQYLSFDTRDILVSVCMCVCMDRISDRLLINAIRIDFSPTELRSHLFTTHRNFVFRALSLLFIKIIETLYFVLFRSKKHRSRIRRLNKQSKNSFVVFSFIIFFCFSSSKRWILQSYLDK